MQQIISIQNNQIGWAILVEDLFYTICNVCGKCLIKSASYCFTQAKKSTSPRIISEILEDIGWIPAWFPSSCCPVYINVSSTIQHGMLLLSNTYSDPPNFWYAISWSICKLIPTKSWSPTPYFLFMFNFRQFLLLHHILKHVLACNSEFLL